MSHFGAMESPQEQVEDIIDQRIALLKKVSVNECGFCEFTSNQLDTSLSYCDDFYVIPHINTNPADQILINGTRNSLYHNCSLWSNINAQNGDFSCEQAPRKEFDYLRTSYIEQSFFEISSGETKSPDFDASLVVTNVNKSSERKVIRSISMSTDRCTSLMKQSQGSHESAERSKLKPVLNRINKFLSPVQENKMSQPVDCFDGKSQGIECLQDQTEEREEEEEMSFRSCDSPLTRNFIRSSSFRSSETPKTSIKDRLAALQDSSEQGWRKRLSPRNDIITTSSPCLASSSSSLSVVKKPISVSSDISGKTMTSSLTESHITMGTLQKKDELQSASSECIIGRPSEGSRLSIACRLSQLEESRDKWMERSPKERQEAHKFTVAGKMHRMGVEGETPLVITKKPAIRPATMFEVSTESQDHQEDKLKDTSMPKVVKIPKMDDDPFFEAFNVDSPRNKIEEFYCGDINNLTIDSSDVLPFVRKIRPKRNNRGSTNPLKTQSLLIEVTDQYVEVRTGVAELEKKRVEKERIVGQTHLAQEALAGLACKENFNQVALRKGGSFRVNDQYEPYKNFMLVHVKGRRICQTRLVEPCLGSFNSGDCFILITPDIVYLWMGKFSNIIERAKAQDLANQIVEKHDMGVKSSCQLVNIDEEKESSSRSSQKLWKALGLKEEEIENCAVGEPGPCEEDGLFETGVISTNKVYRLIDENQLILVHEYSGVVLQCSILTHSECLVFDFGSEMYVWSGKNVPSLRRKKAISLALDIWNKGFDYSQDLLNPICPLSVNQNKSDSKRPSWCIFGKVSENLETILFREKFIDWPDSGRLIHMKGQSMDGNDSKNDAMPDLVPCDVEAMLIETNEPSSLMLEGYRIGRGFKWKEVVDGINWEYEMITSELEVWHVSDSGHSDLCPSRFGQFHSGDTYVIRWKYNINQITRNLKGEISKRDVQTGRNRCAYFFWQGRDSSITEKGASALMTVELNQDRGVHVRLVQGKEPSCFLGLFVSHPMFVYLGKRLENSKSSPKNDVRFSKFEAVHSAKLVSPPISPKLVWVPDHCKRLFMLRNELPEDSYFLEVACTVSSLRSRTSFLMVDVGDESTPSKLFLWHGCKSPQYVRQRISHLASILVDKQFPQELGLKSKPEVLNEVEEGSEPNDFCACFDGAFVRKLYSSLMGDERPADYTPRLFHFIWTSGIFEVEEIQNPASNDLIPSPFPFHQSDLYSVSQPGLFLLDSHHEVFLWQGWWPQSSGDCPNMQTGSASSQFMNTKKCAMQTSINYCKAKNSSGPPQCYLVHAGCEPLQFTSLFPTWIICEDAKLHADQNNLKSEPQLVSEVLKRLSRSTYTWSELQERPLPDGVDPLKLETYLDDEEFHIIMGMQKDAFSGLPQWKQTNLKRNGRLF